MRKDAVTLVTCRTLFEADLIVSRLKTEQIVATIPDKCLMQAMPWPVNICGFVRVQIAPKDHATARELLNSDRDEEAV